MTRIPIFDLDGTLLDSDAALTAAFAELGVAPEQVTFGHVLAEECARLGIAVEDYVSQYDVTAAEPFPGIEEMLSRLERWGLCSNKHPDSGRAELARLGWSPEVALFADAFNGPKRLGPALDAMGVAPEQAVFIGDSDHDRLCARSAGVEFVVAGWNPRARAEPGDFVATEPLVICQVLDRPRSGKWSL
ncbi:MAG: HAD-IA family hydrolase [Acidimicrobiales bacterium]|nr:HAD-IA family hydrolase [Acidimicrobiales bacterium]